MVAFRGEGHEKYRKGGDNRSRKYTLSILIVKRSRGWLSARMEGVDGGHFRADGGQRSKS
jgi:hypothetical protein